MSRPNAPHAIPAVGLSTSASRAYTSSSSVSRRGGCPRPNHSRDQGGCATSGGVIEGTPLTGVMVILWIVGWVTYFHEHSVPVQLKTRPSASWPCELRWLPRTKSWPEWRDVRFRLPVRCCSLLFFQLRKSRCRSTLFLDDRGENRIERQCLPEIIRLGSNVQTPRSSAVVRCCALGQCFRARGGRCPMWSAGCTYRVVWVPKYRRLAWDRGEWTNWLSWTLEGDGCGRRWMGWSGLIATSLDSWDDLSGTE
jgi:hypothetical protein